MRHLSIPLLLATVAAAPVAAQNSVLLRMAPDVGMVSEYHMNMEMFMEGGPLPFPPGQPLMVQNMFTTQTVVALEEENRVVEVTVDSIRMEMPAMPGILPPMDQLAGMRQRMVLSPTGEIVSMEVEGANIPPELREMMEGLNQGPGGMSPSFPDRAVTVGDSWDATSEMEMSAMPGQALSMTVSMTYTVDEIRAVDGAQHVVLSIAGVMESDGAAVELDGEVTGTLEFNATSSQLVSQSMEIIMNMAALGQPMTMRMKMQMDLIN